LTNYTTTNLDLRKLRYFLAVAEELNFSRAARRLMIAGPSLSQQIKALERELKIQLFERSPHSVTLTPVGAALLPHVRTLIAQADELRRQISGIAYAQTIRIGLVARFRPHWEERLSGVVPVTVDTWVLPSRTQAARVSDNNLDLAICHLVTTDLDSSGLEAHLVGVDRLHAISRDSQPAPVRAKDTAVLIEADEASWSSWNNYAHEFARVTGALTVGIDDGGLTGSAFFAHVRRLRRPVLNSPKGPDASLPEDMIRRPIVEPAPLWTWSLIRRRADARPTMVAAVEAITRGVVTPDVTSGEHWLPHNDPHRPQPASHPQDLARNCLSHPPDELTPKPSGT
jgi:DNA-binding transcriptional LysR family regulator